MNSSLRNDVWKFLRVQKDADPRLIDEIKTMWRKYLGFSDEVILERASQVVLIVTRNGEVVGVATADLKRFKLLNNHYFFFYRFFVRPESRTPGLDAKVTFEAVQHLEAMAPQLPEQPIGVIAIIENAKINASAAGRRAVWRAVPFTFIGNVSPGYPVRVYYFKGATI